MANTAGRSPARASRTTAQITARRTNQIPTPRASSTMTSRPIWSEWTAGRLGAKVRRRSRFHMSSDSRPVQFGTVLILICAVGALVAVISFWGASDIYKGLGRSGGLSLDEPGGRPAPRAGSAAAGAEAQEELRQ